MFEVPFFDFLDADMFFQQLKDLFIGCLQACVDLFDFELFFSAVLESQEAGYDYPWECE